MRIGAANSLGGYLSTSFDEKGLRKLLQTVEKDSDSHVQGAALDSLGRITREYQLWEYIPLFLKRIRDRNLDNVVRVSAYTALIHAFDRESETDTRTYNFSFDKPADEQIDWDWIEELSEEYGGVQDDPASSKE